MRPSIPTPSLAQTLLLTAMTGLVVTADAGQSLRTTAAANANNTFPVDVHDYTGDVCTSWVPPNIEGDAIPYCTVTDMTGTPVDTLNMTYQPVYSSPKDDCIVYSTLDPNGVFTDGLFVMDLTPNGDVCSGTNAKTCGKDFPTGWRVVNFDSATGSSTDPSSLTATLQISADAHTISCTAQMNPQPLTTTTAPKTTTTTTTPTPINGAKVFYVVGGSLLGLAAFIGACAGCVKCCKKRCDRKRRRRATREEAARTRQNQNHTLQDPLVTTGDGGNSRRSPAGDSGYGSTTNVKPAIPTAVVATSDETTATNNPGATAGSVAGNPASLTGKPKDAGKPRDATVTSHDSDSDDSNESSDSQRSHRSQSR